MCVCECKNLKMSVNRVGQYEPQPLFSQSVLWDLFFVVVGSMLLCVVGSIFLCRGIYPSVWCDLCLCGAIYASFEWNLVIK